MRNAISKAYPYQKLNEKCPLDFAREAVKKILITFLIDVHVMTYNLLYEVNLNVDLRHG